MEMEAECDMCDALYELFEDELKEREARGITQGIAQGIAQGEAKSLIETCAEFGVTRDDILKRLINKLSLSQEAAENYMQKYWRAQI